MTIPNSAFLSFCDDLGPEDAARVIAWGAAALGYEPGPRQARAERPASSRNVTASEAQMRAAAIPRRVTPAMVDAEIADEEYHHFPGSRLTVCALTLRNGFTVTGESACADPALFDAELGRDLAKGKAREKVFELVAFRLRDELHLERLRAMLEPLKGSTRARDDALIKSVMRRVAG